MFRSGDADRSDDKAVRSAAVPVEAVRSQLEAILASSTFADSRNLSRFLRQVVEETINGRGDRLKEYVVGAEILGKGESFDPKADPSVRIQARRLRVKLAEYYQTAGREDPVSIELPKGSYAPVFHQRNKPVRSRTPALRPWMVIALASILLLTVGLGVYTLATKDGDSSPILSVAVLPFTNLSSEAENEYISEGLTEELIHALMKVPQLRVIALLPGAQIGEDLSQIWKKLKVRTVLRGSVRKSGERLRIIANLIDTRDGRHLWSETYDRRLKDLLATQQDLSLAIVQTLEIKLAGGPNIPLVRQHSLQPEAYDLYLKGRYLLNRKDSQRIKRAVVYFEDAISKDPGYALAYAGLADAYGALASMELVPARDVLPKMKAAALKSLELDDTSAEAHTAASQNFIAAGDFAGGEREFKRAIELSPNYATAHQWYGLTLATWGRHKEALNEISRGLELDPFSPNANVAMAMVFHLARRYDEALEQGERTLKLEPLFPLAGYAIGNAKREKRMYAEALAEFEKAAKLSGRKVRVLGAHSRAPDHPVLLAIPETEYLKCVLLQAVE
jgi:serine/threonine-protein kinase